MSIELILMWVYIALSTAGNVYQAKQIGELESQRDIYKTIADTCNNNDKRTRADQSIVSSKRSIAEQQAESAITEYRESVVTSIQGDSNPCANTSTRDEYSGLLDDERRLLEELHKSRLQP